MADDYGYPQVGATAQAISKLLNNINTKFILGSENLHGNIPENEIAVILNNGHYFVGTTRNGKLMVWESLGLPLSASATRLGVSDIHQWGDACYQYADKSDSTTTCGLYAFVLAQYMHDNPAVNYISAVEDAFSGIVYVAVPQANDMRSWYEHTHKYAIDLQRNDRQMLYHCMIFYPTLVDLSCKAAPTFSPLPNTIVTGTYKSRVRTGTKNLTKDLAAPLTNPQIIEPSGLQGGGTAADSGADALILANRSGWALAGAGGKHSENAKNIADFFVAQLKNDDDNVVKKKLEKIQAPELSWIMESFPPTRLIKLLPSFSKSLKKKISAAVTKGTWLKLAKTGITKDKFKTISTLAPTEKSTFRPEKLAAILDPSFTVLKKLSKQLSPESIATMLTFIPPAKRSIISTKIKPAKASKANLKMLRDELDDLDVNYLQLPRLLVKKLRAEPKDYYKKILLKNNQLQVARDFELDDYGDKFKHVEDYIDEVNSERQKGVDALHKRSKRTEEQAVIMREAKERKAAQAAKRAEAILASKNKKRTRTREEGDRQRRRDIKKKPSERQQRKTTHDPSRRGANVTPGNITDDYLSEGEHVPLHHRDEPLDLQGLLHLD